MQTRYPATIALLTFLSIIFTASCAFAAKLPSFEEVYASSNKKELTAWGHRYARGVGVTKNSRRAFLLFCKSARRGDADAKFELGRLYAFGEGVEKDWELATAWYHEAAADKSRKAQAMLKVLRVKNKPKRRASCPLDIRTADTDVKIVKRRRPSRSHPASGEIAKMVHSMAPKYRLDPNLVLAVVETESGFNPSALSPKNAQGLMQLIPATAARFGVKDVWDPEQNLRGGMAYLRWLLDHFDGNVKLALAGYNAGERAVERHGGIPPYAETEAYVRRIIRRLGGRG